MAIPVPQPELFSITPLLQAWQAGTQARYQEEDRTQAAEDRMRQEIARMAYSANTPELWEQQFIPALQRRFPDADLSEYATFAARDMAIGDGLTLEGQINRDFAERNWNQSQSDRATAASQQAALQQGLRTALDGEPIPTVDPNNPSWMRAGSGATGTNTPPQIDYANAGATRNDPISGGLSNAISAAAAEAGIDRVVVVSGGQEAAGEGGERTGSTRHDHGNAADVELYVGGRLLDFTNPQDQAIYQRFVTAAANNGVTGIGAGTDYMGNSRIHVGFGNPAVWGAGGSSANAPEWLTAAYNAASRERGGGVNMSDQQRALVHALIDGGEVGQALQIITAAMQPPEPVDYGFLETDDGRVLRTDPRGGTATPIYTPPAGAGGGFVERPPTPEEFAAYRIDPNTPGAVWVMTETGPVNRGSTPAAETPTASARDYATAVEQGFTGTQMDYEVALRRAGAPQYYENAYDRTTGEFNAEALNTIYGNETNALDQLQTLGLMEQLVNQSAFYSGTGATLVENLRRFAAAVGVADPTAATSMEAFRALTADATLGAIGGSLGVGISSTDRDYIAQLVPNLNFSVEGNRMLIGIHQAISNRHLEIAELARQYTGNPDHPRLDDGFRRLLAEWALEHPMNLPGRDAATMPGTAGPRPPLQPGEVVDGYRFLGGDPNVQGNWQRVQ